jgi:peptidyl-prolyl cis-trans isomerase C
MSILVNGELVPDELIRAEVNALKRRPEWQAVPESVERSMRMREAAEQTAVDRILLQQEARKDSGPLDAELVAREMAPHRTGSAAEDGSLRQTVEAHLRLERTVRGLVGETPKPTPEDIRRFFDQQRHNFRNAERVHAVHIIKHVDKLHPEEEARSAIEAAMKELKAGALFATVAERHSDCKGNGGDLGTFQRGVMVDEFEKVAFALEPGQRSPIFRSRLGFHIVEVREKIPAGPAKFSEVREDIERVMNLVAGQRALQKAVEILRSRAKIQRISRQQALLSEHKRAADVGDAA